MSANLNPEEISALMSAIEDGRVRSAALPPPVQVVPFDLTSRERLLRGQMPALDSIHEQIATSFGAGLSGRTRLPLRVESSPGTLMPLADLGLLLEPPAIVCIVDLGGGGGEGVLILDAPLAHALIAAALGDRIQEDPSATRRELTPVGKQVLRRLLDLFANAMGIAWSPYLPMHPTVSRFETDPRLAITVAPGGDVAVLTSFEISGALTGRIQLAIPYTAIQPAKKLLAKAGPTARAVRNESVRVAMAAEVEATPVELRALLGRTTITLAKLLELDQGDLLPLSTDEGSPLPLLVEGREKLSGHPLVVRGGLAMKLDRGLVAAASTGLMAASPHPEPT